MLELFSKRQINIGLFLIFLAFIILQGYSAFQAIDLSIWKQSAPLAKGIYNLLGPNILGFWLFDLLASSLLILFQLLLVYNLFSTIKTLEKSSILITWLYLWLIHLFPNWSKFSPSLIALTILVFIIYRIFKSIENERENLAFNIGSIIGLSFLIWYPSILLIIFVIITFFQYNLLNLKKTFSLFLSFIIPIIWMMAYYILKDEGTQLLILFSNFHITQVQFYQILTIQLPGIVVLSLAIFYGFFQAISLSSKTAKQSRLFLNSLLSLIIVISFSFILSINTIIYSFQMLILPFSLFLALFINNFKRPALAEFAHLSIILLIILNFVLINSPF